MNTGYPVIRTLPSDEWVQKEKGGREDEGTL